MHACGQFEGELRKARRLYIFAKKHEYGPHEVDDDVDQQVDIFSTMYICTQLVLSIIQDAYVRDVHMGAH